jgi:hypothetical protein
VSYGKIVVYELMPSLTFFFLASFAEHGFSYPAILHGEYEAFKENVTVSLHYNINSLFSFKLFLLDKISNK